VGGAGGGGTVMQTLDRRISASSDQLDTLRHGGANLINNFLLRWIMLLILFYTPCG
jgi:hypothetical protein